MGSIRMPAIASRDPFVMVPGGPSVPWPPQDQGFNEVAKRALGFAQDEAASLGHNHVGPAHILVGLVREEDGLAARAFAELGITLDSVSTAFASVMGRSETPTAPSDITLIPSAKNVLERAMYESRRLAHANVGTEHLLLAVLRERGGLASRILESLTIDQDDLRTRILGLVPVPPSYGMAEHATPTEAPYDLFDADSKRTLVFAQEEARNVGHHWVGGEHIVLGLARVADVAAPDDAVARVFRELDISLEQVRTKFAEMQPPRAANAGTRDMQFTAETKLIIELAIQTAGPDQLVRPVDLLVAIGRSQHSIGGYLLRQLGATPERVRAIVEGADGAAT
jgi:ATP-dependent Clp protease ATP-binding subunit ClpA